jgi:hypothetical protein
LGGIEKRSVARRAPDYLKQGSDRSGFRHCSRRIGKELQLDRGAHVTDPQRQFISEVQKKVRACEEACIGKAVKECYGGTSGRGFADG